MTPPRQRHDLRRRHPRRLLHPLHGCFSRGTSQISCIASRVPECPAYQRADIYAPEVGYVLMRTVFDFRRCALASWLLVEVEEDAESACCKGDCYDGVGGIAPDGELFLVLGE